LSLYDTHIYIILKNANKTHSNTHFLTHSLWLVKAHMGPTKFIWDLHDLVGPMWVLTNQRECVGECVLEWVLLAFLYNLICSSYIYHIYWSLYIVFLIQHTVKLYLLIILIFVNKKKINIVFSFFVAKDSFIIKIL